MCRLWNFIDTFTITSLVLVFLWKPKSFLFSREIFALSTRILDLDIYLHSAAYRIRVVAAMQWNYRDSNIIFTIVFYVYNIIYCMVCSISTTLPFAARRRDAAVLSGFSILSSYRESNKYLHFYNNEENCQENSQFILSSSFAESTSLLT